MIMAVKYVALQVNDDKSIDRENPCVEQPEATEIRLTHDV